MNIKICSPQNVSSFRVDFHLSSLSRLFCCIYKFIYQLSGFALHEHVLENYLVLFSPEFEINQNKREEEAKNGENK